MYSVHGSAAYAHIIAVPARQTYLALLSGSQVQLLVVPQPVLSKMQTPYPSRISIGRNHSNRLTS